MKKIKTKERRYYVSYRYQEKGGVGYGCFVFAPPSGELNFEKLTDGIKIQEKADSVIVVFFKELKDYEN